MLSRKNLALISILVGGLFVGLSFEGMFADPFDPNSAQRAEWILLGFAVGIVLAMAGFVLLLWPTDPRLNVVTKLFLCMTIGSLGLLASWIMACLFIAMYLHQLYQVHEQFMFGVSLLLIATTASGAVASVLLMDFYSKRKVE